jgi:co-chaperonin GroES (HSP10)
MKPVAIGYRVVIQLDPVEEKTAGGIIITKQRKETDEICTTEGTVADMGEFCFCTDDGKPGFPAPWYKVGDRVLFAEHSGRHWTDEDTGIKYRILNDRDIICVLQ